jgi:23S rRNA (guanosine2251-2'-O)-methyltransferase
MDEPLLLKNPHSVLAVMQCRPKDVFEISMQNGPSSDGWQQVFDRAQQLGIRVIQGGPRGFEETRRKKSHDQKSERTSSTCAYVRPRPFLSLDEVLTTEKDSEHKGYGLWLALDCLQDPHNVGAIIRSASFFGARGVILTKDRSAPINATVYDISAGGIEHLSICLETNLSRALDQAKKQGLWILGTSEHAEQSINQVKLDRHWMIVVGNEQEGMRRLTMEKCDHICSIPSQGGVTSLNASVATGVMLAMLSAQK